MIYRVFPGFIGFDWVLPSFTEFFSLKLQASFAHQDRTLPAPQAADGVDADDVSVGGHVGAADAEPNYEIVRYQG